jgi:hypothetical protein
MLKEEHFEAVDVILAADPLPKLALAWKAVAHKWHSDPIDAPIVDASDEILPEHVSFPMRQVQGLLLEKHRR